MRFGTFPLGEVEGAILVHSVRANGRLFKKGRVLGKPDLEALAAAGIEQVTIARLEPGDLPEDAAATRVAQAFKGLSARGEPADNSVHYSHGKPHETAFVRGWKSCPARFRNAVGRRRQALSDFQAAGLS